MTRESHLKPSICKLLNNMNKCMRSLCCYAMLSGIASYALTTHGCGSIAPQQYKMVIEKDQSIMLRDGVSIFGDVFRPADISKQFPVIFTYGPYCKDMHSIDFDSISYSQSPVQNDLMVWETPDPETWVKDGYVIVRIDQRGSGKSPGQVRILSNKFADDLYDVI